VADQYARLGIERPALPEMGELVRWEPTPGRVKFGRVAAYQTTMRNEVTGLMVLPAGVGRGRLTGPDPEAWPLAETTLVDLSDPRQMLEWMHSE
jgi:hypothetical protein